MGLGRMWKRSRRLTQKAMLKPTSMLLIKPIAAVVWRWSLIFHATWSFLSSCALPSRVHCFLSFFSLFFSLSSPLSTLCHHRKENGKCEITRMKIKIFRTKTLLQALTTETTWNWFGLYRWFLFYHFLWCRRWMNKKIFCELFQWKQGEFLKKLRARNGDEKHTVVDRFQQTNEDLFRENLSFSRFPHAESSRWRHRFLGERKVLSRIFRICDGEQHVGDNFSMVGSSAKALSESSRNLPNKIANEFSWNVIK